MNDYPNDIPDRNSNKRKANGITLQEQEEEVEKVDVNESNTLRSILGHDFTRKEFFQEIWQKQAKYFPLQQHQQLEKSFSSSLSSNGAWRDDEMNHHPLEETVQNGWFVVQRILEYAEEKAQEDQSFHPLIFQNRSLKEPDEIHSLYGNSLFAPYLDGCSVVLNHGDLLSPFIAKICLDLQKEFPHVYANCYLTPPNSQAVPPHADDRDVLVLQIVGSKEWKVYENVPIPYPYPGEEVGKDGKSIPTKVLDGPLCIDTTLEPGDVLYMPRGFVHQAHSPTNKPSFHVTIALATHDWSLAGMISSETKRIMTQIIDFRPSMLPMMTMDQNVVLKSQVDTAITMIKEQITAESIIDKLQAKVESHNQRAFIKRMHLIQTARFPRTTTITTNNNPKTRQIGFDAARRISYDSTIRACTPEERASVSALINDESSSPRGLNVREEIGDSVMTIITALKSNPKAEYKVFQLRSLLSIPNSQLCDLSLLCLAKRGIELGALAVVD